MVYYTPSSSKPAVVINFPEPHNHKDLQYFLALGGCFCEFILNFAMIAQSLIYWGGGETKNKKTLTLNLENKQKKAFHDLKISLCSKPVLSIYNQKSNTEIHTDASTGTNVSCFKNLSLIINCLHPVYYMSKKTSDAEKQYCNYELEVLAILQTLKKCRVYLLDKHFKNITIRNRKILIRVR